MSGVYIPNMEMPKSCLGELNGKNDCPIVGICGIFKATPFKEKENIVWGQRIKDCPLKEVPTHGRLVDIAQFVEDIINSETLKNEFTPYQLTLLRQLAKNVPTIIEAST